MNRKKARFASIRYKSRKMEELIATAQQKAREDLSVLITGERGTGKKLLARAIHGEGDRASSLSLEIDCSALRPGQLEDRLLDPQKGAFSEKWVGGTLLLYELGDMARATQARLRSVLEDRSEGLDVRIIACSTLPGPTRGRGARLLEALYDCLGETRIEIPPLRERKEDIPVLADYFLKFWNKKYRKRVKGLSEAALQFVRRYDWPGNVRQLRYGIRDAVLNDDARDLLYLEHFPIDINVSAAPHDDQEAHAKTDPDGAFLSLDEVEKRHIQQVLELTLNKAATAEILGIARPTLDRKIEAFAEEDDSGFWQKWIPQKKENGITQVC